MSCSRMSLDKKNAQIKNHIASEILTTLRHYYEKMATINLIKRDLDFYGYYYHKVHLYVVRPSWFW